MIAAKDDSQRTEDLNGFWEIKNNPISKVGVFPYLGKSIDPSLDPDKIYMVYRPESELNNIDCINSFKLQPIIDNHTMLGKGATPAENKGVHGVIGEDVYFSGDTLFGNLKIFSDSMQVVIENVKDEISLGYYCEYAITDGIFNGVKYDAVQKNIRGNHLAIVDEGRMGPDVKVLDAKEKFTFAIDSKELTEMAREAIKAKLKVAEDQLAEVKAKMVEAKDESGLAELAGKIDTIMTLLGELKEMEKAEAAGDEEKSEEKKGDPDKAEDEPKEEEKEMKKSEDSKVKGLDAKEVAEMISKSQREIAKGMAGKNMFADKVSNFVGSFDHSEMLTKQDVAEYAAPKLGLKPVKGHELSAVEAFLAAKDGGVSSFVTTAADASEVKDNPISKFLNGGK